MDLDLRGVVWVRNVSFGCNLFWVEAMGYMRLPRQPHRLSSQKTKERIMGNSNKESVKEEGSTKETDEEGPKRSRLTWKGQSCRSQEKRGF